MIGTKGGFDTVNGVATTHVADDDIGHTFTLHGIPGNGKYLFISVPLARSTTPPKTPVKIGEGVYPKPVVVKFSFTTGGADRLRLELRVPVWRLAAKATALAKR